MKRATSLIRAIVLLAMLIPLSKAHAQTQGPNGHYYKVVIEPGLRWEEARIKAAESTFNGVHGHLSTIGSAEEDQFIESLRYPFGANSFVWIGGSQQTNAASSSDGWVWVNGEGFIAGQNGNETYSNWLPGEPNDFSGPNSEQFLAMGLAGAAGWTSEEDDRHIRGYVVEYPSGGVANTISIAAIDQVAVEDSSQEIQGDMAVFEFRREGDLSLDLPVFYSVSGTASNGVDYDEISKSVVIPAGASTVTLNIAPRADVTAFVEPMETVGIRIEPSLILTPEASYNIDLGAREAAVVIYEKNPPPAGALQLAVPKGNSVFTVDEPVVSIAALSFSNAVPSVDFWFTTMSPFASNKIGTATAYLRTNELAFYRMPWTNPLPGDGFITALSTNGSVRLASLPFHVTIQAPTNLPVVQIRAITFDTTNPPPDADYTLGVFEVTRTNSTAGNLQVFYTIGGSATAGADYEALQNYVVIGAGKTTARVIINTIDDTLPEATELVTLSLLTPTNGVPSYAVDPANSQASVQIIDNDPFPTDVAVTIEASSGSGSEPLPWAVAAGEFIVQRTGVTSFPLSVRLLFGGTATPGMDYEGQTNTVIIPAGSSRKSILIEPLADNLIEADETVVAELLSAPEDGVQYSIGPTKTRATVIIHDTTAERPTNAIISIGASRSETMEPAGGTNALPGEFTFIRNAYTNQPLRVYVDIEGTARNGIDYNFLPNVVDFLPGQRQVKAAIVPKGDAIAEGDERIVLRLVADSEYTVDRNNPFATVTIHDSLPGDPNIVVSIEASPETSEPMPPDNSASGGDIIVSRTGSTDTNLRVYFALSGAATWPSDYIFSESITNSVVIISGQTQARFTLMAQADNLIEGDENAVITLASAPVGGGQYSINPELSSGVITIHDEDSLPPSTNVIVSLEPIGSEASEPNAQGNIIGASLLLRRTGPTNSPLAVLVNYRGTATLNEDYTASNVVVFPPGASEWLTSILPLGDNLVEGEETVIAELVLSTNAPLYTIDTNKYQATVTILDMTPTNAIAVVSVEATQPETWEPEPTTLPGQFTIRRAGPTNAAMTVFMFLGGTATRGEDYSAETNSVEFLPGQAEAVRYITPLADALTESDETVFMQLVAKGGVYTVHPTKQRATITIHESGGTNLLSRISIARSASGEIKFKIQSHPGRTIVIERSPDFVAWAPEQTLLIETEETEISLAPPASGPLFYRLRAD